MSIQLDTSESRLEELKSPLLVEKEVTLLMKRDDLIHPHISGNKWRKLKYNLIEARDSGFKTLLTYGGAFSNHILAVAAAGDKFDFQTIGVIRGEESSIDNPTLSKASKFGMDLCFISRSQYRKKGDLEFLDELRNKFGDFYLIPEGGSNTQATIGVSELVNEIEIDFDFLCCPLGTGGTAAGLLSNRLKKYNLLLFPALKGLNEIQFNIEKLINHDVDWGCHHIFSDYHFGGYARYDDSLIDFVNWFSSTFRIQLDPIYTGKMLFGIFDLVSKNWFKRGSKIIALHTGGIQGIEGFNQRFGNKILVRKESGKT